MSDLRLNRHHSQYLQNTYSKHTINDLSFTIIEIVEDIKILGEKEKLYINKYNSYTNGFNSPLGGDGGCLGRKFSKETLQKMSERVKGEKSNVWSIWGT